MGWGGWIFSFTLPSLPCPWLTLSFSHSLETAAPRQPLGRPGEQRKRKAEHWQEHVAGLWDIYLLHLPRTPESRGGRRGGRFHLSIAELYWKPSQYLELGLDLLTRHWCGSARKAPDEGAARQSLRRNKRGKRKKENQYNMGLIKK